MSHMPRVVHFDISAENPERVARFYSDVFGWTINKWDGPQEYWLISTGEGHPGIDGGLSRGQNGSSGTVNTIDVSSVDDFVRRIEENGGKVVAPKMAIPGVGYFAQCQDPSGTMFGIMEPAANAS
jgi:predicted enzyme related to lactoylglutathione lyase